MQEIELKFLVPESRLKGLMRQANIKSISVQIPEPVDSKSVAYKEGYRKIT